MGYKKSEKTKEQIYSTVYRLFDELGYKNTTIRKIASQTNLNAALIYYYYPNGKSDIAQQIINIYHNRLKETILQYLPADDLFFSSFFFNRYVLRELRTDAKEYTFYLQVWEDGTSFIQFFSKDTIEYARRLHITDSVDKIKCFLTIMNSTWIALHKRKKDGEICITYDEILYTAELCAWMYLGFSKEEVDCCIEKVQKILQDIPTTDIKIFS